MIDQGVVSGSNFLTGIMLARFLGMHEFGVFTLAWMAVLFVSSLQMAIIISPMMSIGPKQEDKERAAYYGAVFLQEAVFAAMSFVAVAAFAAAGGRLFRSWNVSHLAWPIAFATLSFQLQDFMRRYLITQARVATALWNDCISYLGQLLALALLFRFAVLTTAAVLWVVALTSLLAFAVAMLFTGQLEFSRSSIRTVWSRHWGFSRWLVGSAFLQWWAGNLFLVTTPVLLGATATGVLRAAQNIMGVTHLWFQGLENSMPAHASRVLYQRGRGAMIRYLAKAGGLWGAATVLYAGGIAIAPGWWMHALYGQGIAAQHSSVLRWYALSYVLGYLALPLRTALRALERTSPIFWSYCAIAIFSAACAVPSVRHFGLNGAVIGIICTQVISLVVVTGSLFCVMRHSQ